MNTKKSFMFVLFVLWATSLHAQAGTWSQVGRSGQWANTTAAIIHQGQLYTTETNGVLYRTNLSTGDWVVIGKPEFADTVFLFSGQSKLYSIENDGS